MSSAHLNIDPKRHKGNNIITFGNISSKEGVSGEIRSHMDFKSQNKIANEYDNGRYTKNQMTSLAKMDSAEKPSETVFDDNIM